MNDTRAIQLATVLRPFDKVVAAEYEEVVRVRFTSGYFRGAYRLRPPASSFNVVVVWVCPTDHNRYSLQSDNETYEYDIANLNPFRLKLNIILAGGRP